MYLTTASSGSEGERVTKGKVRDQGLREALTGNGCAGTESFLVLRLLNSEGGRVVFDLPGDHLGGVLFGFPLRLGSFFGRASQ